MNWLKEVSEASTNDALLAVVNDYLLQHPDDFWTWVPRDSRPSLVATVDEVHEWHRKLNNDLACATQPNVRMQDVCVFFVRASARAHELSQRDTARRESSNDAVREPAKSSGN